MAYDLDSDKLLSGYSSITCSTKCARSCHSDSLSVRWLGTFDVWNGSPSKSTRYRQILNHRGLPIIRSRFVSQSPENRLRAINSCILLALIGRRPCPWKDIFVFFFFILHRYWRFYRWLVFVAKQFNIIVGKVIYIHNRWVKF